MAGDFNEWMTRGPGESALGGILKSAASKTKRRIEKRLATGNLFPHLEHEDRAELQKADQVWAQGDKMVRRCRSRSDAIKGILDADADLRITADDLDANGQSAEGETK